MLYTFKKLKKKSKLEPESINSAVTTKKVELRCSDNYIECYATLQEFES